MDDDRISMRYKAFDNAYRFLLRHYPIPSDTGEMEKYWIEVGADFCGIEGANLLEIKLLGAIINFLDNSCKGTTNQKFESLDSVFGKVMASFDRYFIRQVKPSDVSIKASTTLTGYLSEACILYLRDECEWSNKNDPTATESA